MSVAEVRRMRWPHLALLAALACSAGPRAPDVLAPATGRTGFYNQVQAARGARAFATTCRECHEVREFRGSEFEWEWRRRTVWDFFRRLVATMPEDDPGSLADATYADVVAYILSLNGYAMDGAELAPTEAAMAVIPMGPGARRTPALGGDAP